MIAAGCLRGAFGKNNGVTRSRVTQVEGLGVMWLDDQSHREEWWSLRFHKGGPTNLRTVSPEFGIDAKREELSILTVLSNPIASGLGVLHRPAIDSQVCSWSSVPEPASPAPWLRRNRGWLGTVRSH